MTSAFIALERREAIIEFLQLKGIATTEEIRRHVADTTAVVYSDLRKLKAAGRIQSSNPKKMSDGYKWRLTPPPVN